MIGRIVEVHDEICPCKDTSLFKDKSHECLQPITTNGKGVGVQLTTTQNQTNTQHKTGEVACSRLSSGKESSRLNILLGHERSLSYSLCLDLMLNSLV